MLGVGGVAPPSTPPVVLKRASGTSKPVISSLLLQNQTVKANLSLFPLPNYIHLFPGRNGLRLFAQKKQQGSSLDSIELEEEEDFIEDEGFEFDDVFDEEDEDFDDEEGDDNEDDDLLVPFEKMDAWLKNKPRGFGEGKVYDTSIEDKLMEEIEKSRRAQLANLNKLKNESKEAKPKKELKKELRASEVVSSEIRVRINNLPKKKNVHRDLKSAFQGVRGIVNISPVVAGNQKTRDPVCKGFGFVDFKSLEDANRFVQMFSGQSIAFGKIQKQIKCEVLKSPTVGYKELVQHGNSSTSEPRIAASGDKVDQDSNMEEKDLHFWEDDDFEEFDEDLDEDDDMGDFKLLRALDQDDSDGVQSEFEQESDSSSLRQKKKPKGEKNKSVASRKPDKIPQLSVPGSAMRLKVREKSELSDVFSRHEVKEALASKEKSMASEGEGDQDSNIEEIDHSLQFWEDDEYYEVDEDLDDEAENIELVRASEQEGGNANIMQALASAFSMHNENAKLDAKKSVKEKPEKIPEISILELGKILRIRDPAKLEEFVSRLRALQDRGDQDPNIEDLLQFLEEEAADEFDEDVDDLEFLRALKQGDDDGTKPKTKVASDSSSPPKPKEKKAKAAKNKSVVKEKASKTPKLKVPGSAKRLKGRDKAKLTDVVTKYGVKEALASKET